MNVSFTVPCIPIAEPRKRTRVATIAGRATAMHYTPTKHPVNAFKAACQAAFAAACCEAPVSGAIHLHVTFVLPRTKAQVWKNKPMPAEWHCKKPDLDNLEKSVMDALTGLAWIDDCQVVSKVTTKYIASGSLQPRVAIHIEDAEAWPC